MSAVKPSDLPVAKFNDYFSALVTLDILAIFHTAGHAPSLGTLSSLGFYEISLAVVLLASPALPPQSPFQILCFLLNLSVFKNSGLNPERFLSFS